MQKTPEFVGTATMDDSGTIVLDLVADDGGDHGVARFVYPLGHPQYRAILRHLDGLTPRQQKRVPPWPDER